MIGQNHRWSIFRNEIDNPWGLLSIGALAASGASSETGYLIIENVLNPKQSRGWQSAVEAARATPYEAFVSSATTPMAHHVASGRR